MWKEKFTLRIDAHPEDGMMNVSVSREGDYWIIDGLDSKPVRLPNDDNVLAQIISVCERIVNHPDNPLNATHLKCPDDRCYASDFYEVGENRFYCYGCETQYQYKIGRKLHAD